MLNRLSGRSVAGRTEQRGTAGHLSEVFSGSDTVGGGSASWNFSGAGVTNGEKDPGTTEKLRTTRGRNKKVFRII